MLGSGGGGGDGTEEAYFAKWEEKYQHLLAAAVIRVTSTYYPLYIILGLPVHRFPLPYLVVARVLGLLTD